MRLRSAAWPINRSPADEGRPAPGQGCILIYAPLGRDAEALAKVAGDAGPTRVCADIVALAAALVERPLSVVVSEEGAGEETGRLLLGVLEAQPSWSRLPILFLLKDVDRPPPAVRSLAEVPRAVPYLVLRRPAAPEVLRRALGTMVADRRRQFETADLLDRLERSERRQSFLLDELRHRTRNMLAVLQSLFKLSVRGAPDVETLGRTFLERLRALSEAHAALTVEGREARDLGALIDEHTRPYRRGDGQLLTTGPAVRLSGEVAVDLAMVVHELATNSSKYGAFSVPSGRVSVDWQRDGTAVCLNWQESGGPTVGKPAHRGLGTQLIEGGALKGAEDTRIDFRPEGIVWRTRLRLT